MAAHSKPLPDAARSGDVAVFERYLAASGQGYVLAPSAQRQQVHVRFSGPLHGRAVVWDCRLVALAGETTAEDTPTGAAGRRNYIEVGQPGPQGVPLRVGLDLACIDRPAIEKMIIMIRNYKHLDYGRHEYGGSRA